MVIKKCYKYYDGLLSPQAFVDWLKRIILDPVYEVENHLKQLMEGADKVQ